MKKEPINYECKWTQGYICAVVTMINLERGVQP